MKEITCSTNRSSEYADSVQKQEENVKKKIILLIITGILFIYPIQPFLHESGHAIATLLLHGKIKDFLMFPQPSVIVDIRGLTDMQLYLISISGTIFPCLLAMFPLGKTFFGKLCMLFLRIEGIVTCIMTLGLIGLTNFGIADKREDIIRALNLYDNKAVLIAIYLTLLTIQIFLIWKMIRTHIQKLDKEETP